MKEDLQDIMDELLIIKTQLKYHNLESLELEVLASAFLYLKQNPDKSVLESLDYGYSEWIK